MYNFAKEIEQEFENARNRTGQKKKIREIMAQYGETVQDIENNAPDNVYMEFILAGGRDMLEQVKKEDTISQPQYNPPKQSAPSLQNNDDEVIEEEEEEEEVIENEIKAKTKISNKNTADDSVNLEKIQKNSEKQPEQQSDENAKLQSQNKYSNNTKNIDKIQYLKSALSDLGYYKGKIDHFATPELTKAMHDFSEDHNINETHENKLIEKITQKVKSIESPARLDFDGQYLRWIENGKVKLQIRAMSGRPDYQNRKYQNVKDKGPLPEGNYRVKQNQIQDIDNSLLEKIGRGKAPGGRKSWGYSRVWLQPFSSNEMYGREKLTIHGGEEFGSAGCIDLEKNDRLFFNMLRQYGNDIILNVHYDKEILK